jgi:3D (Asp-Asp-Asp) domain-containing protein
MIQSKMQLIGWGDCDESQCLLYDTSLVETAVETDASGEVEGYLVYKINSTTYGNTKQLTGEYNYGFSTIPRSISGSAIGSSVSPEIIRLSSDDEVTLSKANAALISDITVDASNDIIDLSDEDLSDAYDNLKYQVASTEDIYTNIPGVMYYGLYGSPLRKSGTSYTARTDTTTYEQLACNGYTFNDGLVDWDAPTSLRRFNS